MVAESQTQGVLTQHSSAQNGSGKHADTVKVESPSHVTDFYPPNTLGCGEGMLVFLHSLSRSGLLNLNLLFQEEWKARVDLAAIHRLCHNNVWNEGIQNHLTAAVPGRTDQFLIIAFGLLWNQVTHPVVR